MERLSFELALLYFFQHGGLSLVIYQREKIEGCPIQISSLLFRKIIRSVWLTKDLLRKIIGFGAHTLDSLLSPWRSQQISLAFQEVFDNRTSADAKFDCKDDQSICEREWRIWSGEWSYYSWLCGSVQRADTQLKALFEDHTGVDWALRRAWNCKIPARWLHLADRERKVHKEYATFNHQYQLDFSWSIGHRAD